MSKDISQYIARINKLTAETTYAQRRRNEEAEKAVKALEQITDDDVALLKDVVPELTCIRGYTVESIKANANNEIDTIANAVKKLEEYLDERLSYYEERL